MGIDQSLSSTGIVIRDPVTDSIIAHINIKTKPKDFKSDRERIKYIYEEILEACDQHKCTKAVVESPSLASKGRSTRTLAGLFYVVIAMLVEKLGNDNVFDVAPTSLKKHATGYGKAEKQQMIDTLPDHMKAITMTYNKANQDDMADAYWLSTYLDT